MGDILGTALTGLLSFQRALSTTSHNIANVNTDGYSRQRVDLVTNDPTRVSGNFIGNGVEVNSIRRIYDQFITNSIRDGSSSYARLEKFTELAGGIDNLLADPQGGISPILQDFFSAVQDVADDPTSGPARIHLLNVGEALVNRFSSLDTRLEQLSRNTEADILANVTEINQLAAEIGNLNKAIQESSSTSRAGLTQQSADLLDQRDSLLEKLASKVSIQVINESQDNMTVLIGNGQTMVSGNRAFSLSVQPDSADRSESIIVYNGFSTVNDISAQLNGGELGGLLDFRSTLLNPAKNSVGRIAIGLGDSFNDQHRAGMDLQNNLGGDFFTFNQPRSIANSANAGSAVVTTAFSDINQLTTNDYTMNFDGVNWTITSGTGSSGTIVPPSGTFEGLDISISAGAVAGDRFLIQPTAEGAGSIKLAFSDPRLIAAAAPIRTGSSLNNLGNIEISQGIITSATNPAALDPATFTPVTLTFETPATTFTSNVSVTVGAVLYAPGASIPYSNNMVIDSSPGAWQVNLSGNNPQPGDILTIEANLNGTGDNRNAQELAQLQVKSVLNNGVNNYQDAYSALIVSVGSATHFASVDRDAEQTLLDQAVAQRSEVSGVNLDEEAADLIKYQQAYQAAARVISAAQELFDTLINSTR